jgi:ABC-type branched-subunit amino acid transport system substrate-binding protein
MINSQGGVCGRKLTLVKGDDGLDPARARGEFVRLEPQVLGFVGSFSVADSGYIDLIEKSKVPYIGAVIDPSGRKLPNAFPKASEDKIATGPFFYLRKEHPDAVKAAVLYADVAAVKANLDGTVKAVEAAGFQLVSGPIAVGVADPDYTGTIRNLQDKGVEAVFVFSFEVNMHVRFNRNMKQQRYEPKLKAANIAFNDRFSKLLGADGDGWEDYLAYLPFLDPAEKARSKPVNDFLTWNARVFPGAQLDLFNISGWGRAAMFVDALRTVGSDVNRVNLLKVVSQIPTFNGGGLEVDSNPQTGDINKCFVMTKHEGGSWHRSYPTGAGYDCDTGQVLKYK